MKTLAIKSAADLLGFIKHTLRSWPQESLVCVTVGSNHADGAIIASSLGQHCCIPAEHILRDPAHKAPQEEGKKGSIVML